MAVSVEGGTITWEWEPGNDNVFFSQGDRAYFRLVEYETASVTATLSSDFGMECQAVLRVIMQGGFPMFEED
jgi:hypothetical protein